MLNWIFLELGWGDVDWIDLAQDRNRWTALANSVLGSIKCWETIQWSHNWWPHEQCSTPCSLLVSLANN
jgi:hypothetical protein